MTDRRKERDRARRKRRKAREADERRRVERNRRFDELVEAWRRNHPGEHEEDRKDRPTQGRMFFGRDLTRCTIASENEAEGSLVDVACADTVGAELDRLISKRASQDRRLDPDEQETTRPTARSATGWPQRRPGASLVGNSYYNPESGECFLHACACIRAGYEGDPFPEPPETIKALTRARNRAAALDTACGGGFDLFPYEREALVERGELVPHSLVAALVAGREPGEPLEDLSE
jgi:hypothetical protein